MNRRVVAVAAGDLAAMAAFTLIGLASHEREITAWALARSFAPFAATWLAAGAPLGAFRRAGPDRHFLLVYLACAAVALALRSLAFGRPLFSAFSVIATLGNGLFLGAWRLIFQRGSAAWGRTRPAEADAR